MENNGAKGQSHVLLEAEGSGIINRIWLTLSNLDSNPYLLRAVKIEFFWDHNEKPAVSAPLGDFFGAQLGVTRPFQSVFLSNPEGRSFNSFFKMLFLKASGKIRTIFDHINDFESIM